MKSGTENTIPVVVGVTGHRTLRKEDEQALRKAVEGELRRLMDLCPHSELMMLSSLAEGGDLICAETAEVLGIPLIAVLPRPKEEYVKDFSENARSRFDHQCARAQCVFTAPPTEAVPEVKTGKTMRNFEFRQAGIYVAAHCHILLALWDGGEGTSAACGTAEAVGFALQGNYRPAAGVSMRSDGNEAVIHVVTPRGERNEETAGTVHILGNREAVMEVLRKTDDFNCDAAQAALKSKPRVPLQAEDQCLRRMDSVSRAAGQLSRFYARRYRQVLASIATASALLTFAFLLYDEAQAIWLILVCGVMLLADWFCQDYAVRSDCHRRYLDYRALGECLRVQTYLRYAGSRVNAEMLLSWSQQEETAWVLDALCAMSSWEPAEQAHSIEECWIKEQLEYHRKALVKAEKKLKWSEQIVRNAILVSVVLYVLAVLFEFLSGGILLVPTTVPVDNPELWRTWLKILLGTISAVTLFVANYFGRLSLQRKSADHQKMENLFKKMEKQIEAYGQTEEILTTIAREELSENGNWYSYQKDNKPDFSL